MQPEMQAPCLTVPWHMFVCCMQVLHLCAVIMPNQDATFALSIIWSTIQVLCSNFFISFGQV